VHSASSAFSRKEGGKKKADALGFSQDAKHEAKNAKAYSGSGSIKDEESSNGSKSHKNSIAAAGDATGTGRKKRREKVQKQGAQIQIPAPRPRESVIPTSRASGSSASAASEPNVATQQSSQAEAAQSHDWLRKSHTVASGMLSKLGWSSSPAPSEVDPVLSATAPPETLWMDCSSSPPGSWASTWPSANLDPVSDPIFDPAMDPVFRQAPGNVHNVEHPAMYVVDSITMNNAEHSAVLHPDETTGTFQQHPPTSQGSIGLFNSAPGPFSARSASGAFGGGLGLPDSYNTTAIPPVGGLQAELLSGASDPWASMPPAPPSVPVADSAGIPSSHGTIGGGRHWQCEKCGFRNALGATRCGNCQWDRKAALKNRIRQELIDRMASNGGIPSHAGAGM